MNLSINNVNFSGRKEVMYGIKRAAVEARCAEVNRSYSFEPRTMNREFDRRSNMGALFAYSDMVVRDSSFTDSIKEIVENKDFMSSLRNLLAPIKMTHGKINPLEKFQIQFSNAAKDTENPTIIDAAYEFLSKF